MAKINSIKTSDREKNIREDKRGNESLPKSGERMPTAPIVNTGPIKPQLSSDNRETFGKP